MMRLTETAGGLSVGYSAWLGLMFLSLGIALVVHIARRFKATGKFFGYVVATGVCLFAGLHFLTYKATVDADGARVYELLRRDARVAWPQVMDVRFEERSGARGGREMLLVFDGGPEPVDIVVTPLSPEERVRITEYAAKRMQAAR